MSKVVPTSENGAVTAEAVEDFRSSTLTNPVWNTGVGQTLLQRFWQSWLGRWITRKFGDATPQELHGYAYWGPVALAIAVIEILGALSKTFRNAIPWPTISSTVGHIQDLDGRWGLAVVFVIALAAFGAVLSSGEARPPGTQAIFLGVRYGWPLVFVITGVTALLVSLLDDTANEQLKKFHLGYAIYGAFAVFGIVIPMILVWRKSNRVVFPGVFYTFRKLRERFRWIAAAVTGGLAMLLIHLALYPWPNLAREPASYAGLNGYHARVEAENAIKRPANGAKSDLVYSTEGRGISSGHDVWFVHFNVVSTGNSTYTGCVVEVTSAGSELSQECKK